MPTVDLSTYHQPSGTAADGTKYDNLIDAVQAALNGLDKNNLAAAAGILASQLADPTTGKVLGSSGSACAAVYPPGYEFDYAQVTAVSTTATATTEATANAIVTGNAVTYDGATPVIIKFSAPALQGSAAMLVHMWLYDGAASIGEIGAYGCSAGSLPIPILLERRLTPSAGAHTYSVRASVTTGTASFVAGPGGGGGGIDMPLYIRITKV